MTRQELNQWKKQFKTGDKVRINRPGTEYHDKIGVVSHKTSYVFVEVEGIGEVGFRTGLEILQAVAPKPKAPKPELTLEVGDWVNVDSYELFDLHRKTGVWTRNQSMRVSRVTKSSYWLEVPMLKAGQDGNWCNGKTARLVFNDVHGNIPDHNYQDDVEFYIPFESNRKCFEFVELPKRFGVTKYGHHRKVTDTTKQGYHYEYRMS